MERHFQNFWKFLFLSYANRPKFTLTSKLNFSACEGCSRKPPVPGEGPTYWLSNGVPQPEFRGTPLGRFWPQRGVTFSRFLAIFPKFWKKKGFFFFFWKGPWVPSKGQKKFGPAVIFVGNMANSKFRPFGASLRGGFFKMAISRPRSKISKFYLIRASSGSRGPPLGHKKHQKSKTHMYTF